MTDHPLENLANSLAHAQHVAFPDIVYLDRDWERYHKTKEDVRIEKKRRPSMNDILVSGMFAQTWGSTALGFGGIGGAAMTNAYTVVLYCEGRYAVYFGGRFAYLIQNPSLLVLENIAQQHMLSLSESGQYERDFMAPTPS